MNFSQDSQDINFKTPFGAAKTGSFVSLMLRAEDISTLSSFVRLWYDGKDHLVEMDLESFKKTRLFATQE